ncbi:MAG: NADH-quinone oxidoreductase subunit NuoK [Candidatus Bathyarchaeia archaeon]
MVPLAYYLACSTALFFIGLYCLIVKRNMIRLLMALEIMLNGANLNFIALSSYHATGFIHPLAHVFTIISIGIGGCIVALGLVITIYAYRHYGTLDVRELRRLKH